jgi:hypothetical protein
LWDKFVAIWMLTGLASAALCCYWTDVKRVITWRHTFFATLFFLLGASPLLLFNINKPLGTFTEAFAIERHMGMKLRFLHESLDGNGLFGWLTLEDVQTEVHHRPNGLTELASFSLSNVARKPRRSLLEITLLLSCLAVPFVDRSHRKLLAFCFIAFSIAWLQMAINTHSGGSVHHTILLWPLPHIFIAVSLGGISERFSRAFSLPLLLILSLSLLYNVILINEYRVALLRNGGTPAWNDAIIPLSDLLRAEPSRHFLCLDWGILDPLRFLGAGSLSVSMGDEQFLKKSLTTADFKIIREMISNQENHFIAHCKGYENFPGVVEQLVAYASVLHLHKHVVNTIQDSFGRDVFEVFTFAPDV